MRSKKPMTIYPDDPPRQLRQRHYRHLLPPDPAPRLDSRDARWTTQRAVGSREALNRYLPLRGTRGIIPLPQQIRGLGV